MTDKQKIEAILNLLTDKTHGKLVKEGVIRGRDESFGAMVLLTRVFNEAYKIARS